MSNPIEHRRGMFNRPEFDELVDGYNQSIPPLTKDVTYHVSPTGNDSNDGLSSATPLKTINAALNKLPTRISAKAVINLAPGTYTEYIKDSRTFLSSGTDASISFIGSFENYTPTVGPASGTFDASFGANDFNVAVVTGANWAVDELKGKYIEVTSGTFAGRYYPIMNNTADTLSLTGIINGSVASSSLLNLQFKIVQHAVVLLHPLGNLTSLCVLGGSSTNSAVNSLESNYIFKNILFKITETRSAKLVEVLTISALFESCSFENTGTAGTLLFYGIEANRCTLLSVRFCRFYQNAINSNSYSISLEDLAFLNTNSTGIDGSSRGISISEKSTATVNGCVLQNNTFTSIYSISGTYTNTTSSIIKNSNYGFWGYGEFLPAGQQGSGSIIKNCTTAGIFLSNYTSFRTKPFPNTNLTIDGCPVGIRISYPQTGLLWTGPLTIKNSSTCGVWVEQGQCQNSGFGYQSSTFVATGNTRDFTFDGTTPISLANVEAAPNKLVTDAFGNYIRGL